MDLETNVSDEVCSVSEDNPINSITDDLYVLKSSLVKDKKLTSDAMPYFNQIENITQDFPELNKNLYEWKFLENEILYFLRGHAFDQGIRVATRILTVVNKAPNLYFTKKFLFFITEKLYTAMGGTRVYKQDTIEFIGTEDTSEAQPHSQIFFNHTDRSTREFTVNQTARLIMLFIKRLIEINRNAVNILCDIMFFELANVCVCVETAQMLNAVFVGISYFEGEPAQRCGQAWQADGLYEIQRTHFEPEIVFRDKEVFSPITPVENLRGGIFKQIYDQCTNLFNFADLSFKDSADILLFKRVVYMSDELEVLLLEAKDPKVVSFYRRSLEAGAVCDGAYLNSMIKAVDNPKTSRDACIVLSYLMNFIVNFKPFTESRVRRILECLEHACGSECTHSAHLGRRMARRMVKTPAKPTDQCSFDGNLYGDAILMDTCDPDILALSGEDEKPHKGILDDFSEFDNGFEAEADVSVESTSSVLCDQYRILKLLKHIYPQVNRRFIFKPSLIILLRSALEHVAPMRAFILEIFDDFVSFLKLDRSNMARVFLPVDKKPRSGMVQLKLDDDAGNAHDVVEYELAETPYTIRNDTVGKGHSEPQFRVNRGVIESDDEAD